MKAIVITALGGPDVLQLQDVAEPVAKAGHVVVRIAASAVNRADTYQRHGTHPVPQGWPPYPGLECSGTIESVAEDVHHWKVGDQVSCVHYTTTVYSLCETYR